MPLWIDTLPKVNEGVHATRLAIRSASAEKIADGSSGAPGRKWVGFSDG